MKPVVKKWLKRAGLFVGALVLMVIAFGIYVYSLIPKPIGTPTVLQAELFAKPAQPLPVEELYLYKSATELASMIRNRQATSLDIVKTYLAHIKNNNYKYNALIWLREKEALEDAKKADEAVARGDFLGPLHGVPVTIKEMFWVKGSPSTMNAKMFGFTAPRDGALTEQLKKAGAIVLGTTNVPYMLSDFQTSGEVYPTGNNPYDTTRTPGGSTGGGAAALAAGFTTLELGSDLGGSIRVPAAFCGLYGLKPTFGAVNITDGSGPDTTTKYTRLALASPGPLARSPEDLELMWNVIRDTRIDERFQKKTTWKPASSKSINQYRFAWMDDWKHGDGIVEVGSEVKEKLVALTGALKQQGAAVEKTVPDTYDAMARNFLGSFASMMSEGQPWVMRKLMGMGMGNMNDGSPNFQAFYDGLNDSSDAAWQKIQNDRKSLIDQWEKFFQQYDFFICPITYGPAFRKCKPGTPLLADGKELPYMRYPAYSYIFNATGHPCLIIPMGLNKEGLPIALQIVGPNYSESELLHLAKLLEPMTPGFIKPKT